jgi:hypothetical protein
MPDMASRRLAAAVAMLAASALLVGCSPPLYRQVAVHLVDGEVEFLFSPCPGKRVHDVIVREVGPEAETGRTWHVSGGPDDATVTSLRLFDVPDGWLTGADDLTELDPSLSYRIRAEVDSVEDSLVVGVTLDALAALGDDEVLGPGRANEAVAMPHAEFAEIAAEPCG